jgi:hypothetical protein
LAPKESPGSRRSQYIPTERQRQDERYRHGNEEVVCEVQGLQMNYRRQQCDKKDHRLGIAQGQRETSEEQAQWPLRGVDVSDVERLSRACHE